MRAALRAGRATAALRRSGSLGPYATVRGVELRELSGDKPNGGGKSGTRLVKLELDVVDRTGYKRPMYGAFLLQAVSGVLFFTANSYDSLYLASVCAGLGHGIVEAVINPVCAAVYPKDKTKRLTILHAAWPAGVAGGTLLIMGADGLADITWRACAAMFVEP